MSSNQAKNTFWELDINTLDKELWVEATIWYLRDKFDWDIVDILQRVEEYRKSDWYNLPDNY